MIAMPEWRIPENLDKLIHAGDGIWEDDRWAPLLLTVMTGTTHGDREIPKSWQIEFQPDDDAFEATNSKLEGLGLEPDGYGWSSLIQATIEQHLPHLVEALHFDDTEETTCVVWTESEDACRQLVEVTWNLIYS